MRTRSRPAASLPARKTPIAAGKASAIARPMPLANDPCPWKQNAIFALRARAFIAPFDQTRPPREARTHPGHQHEPALREAPVGLRVGERERDRSRRRVAVAVDVDHDLLPRNAELVGGMLDDPHVRLVGD